MVRVGHFIFICYAGQDLLRLWYGKLMFDCDDMNLFTKTGVQQFPGLLPTLALGQATQGENSLSAGLSPGHTRLFQSLSDQGFTSGFNNATADRNP